VVVDEDLLSDLAGALSVFVAELDDSPEPDEPAFPPPPFGEVLEAAAASLEVPLRESVR
jgi:hypothetical protein